MDIFPQILIFSLTMSDGIEKIYTTILLVSIGERENKGGGKVI